MALSGTIKGSCVANNGASSKYEYELRWSATQNVSSNTSSVTVTAYVRANNSTYGTSTNWTSKIEGSTVKTFSAYIGQSGSGTNWVNFGSKTFTVNHASNGTASVTIDGSFSGTYNGSYALRSGSASQTVTLNTIPRASSFSMSTTNMTLGSTECTITINRASSSFTHKVYYKYGSINHLLHNGSSTSIKFTPSIGDASQTPNATKGTGTIVVDTYSGSSKIGSSSKSFTNNVPSSVVPSYGALNFTVNNSLSGHAVAGKSTFTLQIDGASGSHGSSITNFSITGHSISCGDWKGTTGGLSSGTHRYTGKITDSRGRTHTKTRDLAVHSYSNPWINNVRAVRCNSSYGQDDNGTYVRVYWQHGITNVANANVNAKQYKVSWANINSSSWNTIQDWTNLTNYSDNAPYKSLGGNWATNTSYQVKVEIRDSYTTVSAIAIVGTSKVVMNMEKDGIGIGKFHERGGLDVAGSIYTDGTVNGKFSGRGFIAPQTGRTQSHGDLYSYNTTSGSTSSGAPTTYTSVIGFGEGASGTVEIAGGWTSSGGLWYRQLRDVTDNWYGWKRIYTSDYKPSCADIGAIKGNNANGYWGLSHPNGNSTEWIRTTVNGLLPYQSGTSGQIGHQDWWFNRGYFNEMYVNKVRWANDDWIDYSDSTNRWYFSCDGGGVGKSPFLGIEGASAGNTTSESCQTVLSSPDRDHWLRLKNDATATWAGKSILSTLSLVDNDVIETRAISEDIDTLSLIEQGETKSLLVVRKVDGDNEEEVVTRQINEQPIPHIVLDTNAMPEILKDNETGEIDFGSTVAVLWDVCQKQQQTIATLESELLAIKQHLGLSQ